MEYSKEFRQAINAFSSVQKDRLIIRLLKKDRILSEKLYFELIDPDTQDEKRAQMETLVKNEVAAASNYLNNAKYFLRLIRKISSKITEHVKITSDKLGEVSLNLLLVNEILTLTKHFRDGYKLYIYLLNKIFRMLVLTQKLDADYFLELNESFEQLHERILKNSELAQLALHHGLDLNWLQPENIPEHIAIIQKDLKSDGFLR